MKKYIKPSMSITAVELQQMIAASGDEQAIGITNTTFSGTFNSRERDGGWFEEDEE